MSPGQDDPVPTVGTDPVAAARLALLADVYEPISHALLARWCPPSPGQAVDLGCGHGYSTLLLHRVSGATRTTGVERSPEFVRAAREHAPDGVTIVQADVTREGLPVQAADIVYARFLLTHLGAPGAALRLWGDLLRPAGRLVLQEVARLVSREPALGRFYELVAELQDHHGQSLDVGKDLGDLAADSGWPVEHAAIRSWHPPVASMATLHVLYLRSWRAHPFAARAFDPDELDALDEALAEIAHGRPAEPIEQDLAEVVLTTP